MRYGMRQEMTDGCTRRPFGKRHPRKQRRRKARFKRRHVLVGCIHLGFDVIRYPARQRETLGRDCVGRKERVIEAAKPETHHQKDGQAEPARELRRICRGAERYAEPTHALHHHSVSTRHQGVEGVLDPPEFDRYAFLCRRDMRGDRRPKSVRIDQLAWCRDIAGGYDLLDIGINNAFAAGLGARGDRLHADGPVPGGSEGPQKSAGDQRFADSSVCTCHEKSVSGG